MCVYIYVYIYIYVCIRTDTHTVDPKGCGVTSKIYEKYPPGEISRPPKLSKLPATYLQISPDFSSSLSS